MSRHKAYALSPRDCLKTTLFQKWQRIIAPPGKRGRRTVALHEKHQPVRSNGHRVDNGNRFLPSRNDASVVVAFPHRAATLGSTGFSSTAGNRPIFSRILLRQHPLSLVDDISRFSHRPSELSATVESRKGTEQRSLISIIVIRFIDRSGACEGYSILPSLLRVPISALYSFDREVRLTALVTLDFSRAFGIVNHQLLLVKVKYCMSASVLVFFRSSLTNRSSAHSCAQSSSCPTVIWYLLFPYLIVSSGALSGYSS